MPTAIQALRLFSTALAATQLFATPTLAQNFIDASFEVSYPGLSSTCISALNGTVACLSSLGGYGNSSQAAYSKPLEAFCTEECYESLSTIRRDVEASCTGASDSVEEEGGLRPATWIIDQFIYTFNTTCVKDRNTGSFCGTGLQTWSNVSVKDCSNCALEVMSAGLSSPIGYFAQGAQQFESMVSSCHISGYSLHTPSIAEAIGALPTSNLSQPLLSAPKACEVPYTILEGDTCNSIAAAQKVSTFGVIYINNLDAYCANLPDPGWQICLPESCDIQTVQKSQACEQIINESAENITLAQLRSWNPNIDRVCNNLDRLTDSVICVSPPGGFFEFGTKNASISSSTDKIGGKIAAAECSKYHTVKAGENWASISMRFGISLKGLRALNEELEEGECEVGEVYCVEAGSSAPET